MGIRLDNTKMDATSRRNSCYLRFESRANGPAPDDWTFSLQRLVARRAGKAFLSQRLAGF
jgi:hypothetical protein